MAITLNGGTGVITGVAVGGLPDGCVANDDLAGSIADGKITGLTASKLTGALPAISGASLTGISAGKIIQHRYDMSAANDATSSTSYVVTSLSQTITPASASNDILVLWMSAHIYQDTTNIGYYYDMTVFRDGTNQGPANGINGHYGQQANIDDLGFSVSFMFLDEPASTSSLTYDIRHKVNTGSASINMGHRGYSYMHLFELEGGTD